MLNYLVIFLCCHLVVLAQDRPVLTYSRPDGMFTNLIHLHCEDGIGPVDDPVFFRNGSHFMTPGNGVTFQVNRSTEGVFECARGASLDPNQRSQSQQHIVGEYMTMGDLESFSNHLNFCNESFVLQMLALH